MIYDSHSHLMPDLPGHPSIEPEEFLKRIRGIGVEGGSIFSLPPKDWLYPDGVAPSNEERVAHVLDFCSHLPKSFYPFYWINPTEPDAVEQVIYAKEHGIRGFKVLCSSYYPEQGMAAYVKAAELNLPVHFHSGILWDGQVSGMFNRPLNFECLLNVRHLRFALAHMSWPWCDECIALFGKFRNTQNSFGDTAAMYVDCSPGAPEFDRAEAFRKMALINYGFETRLLWGIDNEANHFSPQWGAKILASDRRTFEKLHVRYSDAAVLEDELCFSLGNRTSVDFRTFFRRATEENYLEFIGE